MRHSLGTPSARSGCELETELNYVVRVAFQSSVQRKSFAKMPNEFRHVFIPGDVGWQSGGRLDYPRVDPGASCSRSQCGRSTDVLGVVVKGFRYSDTRLG